MVLARAHGKVAMMDQKIIITAINWQQGNSNFLPVAAQQVVSKLK